MGNKFLFPTNQKRQPCWWFNTTAAASVAATVSRQTSHFRTFGQDRASRQQFITQPFHFSAVQNMCGNSINDECILLHTNKWWLMAMERPKYVIFQVPGIVDSIISLFKLSPHVHTYISMYRWSWDPFEPQFVVQRRVVGQVKLKDWFSQGHFVAARTSFVTGATDSQEIGEVEDQFN